MFGRIRRLRDGLDGVRVRFERQPARPSLTPEEALDRLARAVDDHLRAQEDDRLVAERLVSGLDVVPQGIVLADASGEIVFRNRTAAGFESARHGDALVEQAIGELLAVAVAGESVTRTLELFGPPRRALQLRAVSVRAPFEEDGGGEALGAFLVVEDVSERQRLEAVRRDFVANISHELKTPVGALGVLAEALAGETDPDVIEHLAARMQREAFRVATTIDDLLELSQIEASDLPDREPVPVERVVREAVERTAAGAEQRGVALVVDAVPAGSEVWGDRRQLVSALTNLCDNAVKYSEPGSDVHVRASVTGELVELAVVDQGIGIPARDLERVFERFYRVDRARSRHTGGTGLGLAIVRHVVQNHGGEVDVTSREGEGSTFTLRLPAARGGVRPVAPPAPGVPGSPGSPPADPVPDPHPAGDAAAGGHAAGRPVRS